MKLTMQVDQVTGYFIQAMSMSDRVQFINHFGYHIILWNLHGFTLKAQIANFLHTIKTHTKMVHVIFVHFVHCFDIIVGGGVFVGKHNLKNPSSCPF